MLIESSRGPCGVTGDVVLRDGDKLMVWKKTQEITIKGEVQSLTSHILEPGVLCNDYVVKRGSALGGGRRYGWFRHTQSVDMQPVIPLVSLDTERTSALPFGKTVTTIVYILAVSLAAIRLV